MCYRIRVIIACLLAMVMVVPVAVAETVVLDPVLFGSTREDVPTGFSGPFDSAAGGTTMVIGKHGSTGANGPDWNGWMKFDIPDFDGPAEIVSAILTIDVGYTGYPNGAYVPGIRAYYMTDDSWTSDTITDTHAVTTTYVQNRDWLNSVPFGTNQGPRSNDITTWLELTGEGQGSLLSIKLDRDDSLERGRRGASGTTAWLTLETQELPEPMTLTGLLIGAGALALRRRRSAARR